MVRSHLEDHKGVSMQVLMPVGDPVTVARFAEPAKLLVSTGEALGNVDNQRGCRTKIRTRVKDARKLLEGWTAAVADRPGSCPARGTCCTAWSSMATTSWRSSGWAG